MNKEIKEIFNKYGKEKYNDEYCLEFETYIIELQELKKIYDYITNLQERFNALLEAHKIADELETEYQNRINKAIEYIETKYNVLLLSEPPKQAFKKEDLLNILKGE